MIRWVPYLSVELQPVRAEDIAEVERKWGVRLPAEYKRLVAAHQGMAPEPGVFDVGRGANVFGVLLTLKSHEGREDYSVTRTHDVLKSFVPEGVFPFAGTPTGESLCFDYRAHPHSPPVVFVTVEGFIHSVADNLMDLLARLHD